MSYSSWLVAAVSAAALSACAGNGADTSSDLTQSAAPATTQSQSTQTQSAQTTTPQAAQPTTPPAQPASYTDAQLRSFAAAALEIQPITQTLPTATPEQRTAAADQIRAILTRHNLDGATYNAIAAQAQADPAFAARIVALAPPAQPPSG